MRKVRFTDLKSAETADAIWRQCGIHDAERRATLSMWCDAPRRNAGNPNTLSKKTHAEKRMAPYQRLTYEHCCKLQELPGLKCLQLGHPFARTEITEGFAVLPGTLTRRVLESPRVPKFQIR